MFWLGGMDSEGVPMRWTAAVIAGWCWDHCVLGIVGIQCCLRSDVTLSTEDDASRVEADSGSFRRLTQSRVTLSLQNELLNTCSLLLHVQHM